MHFRSPRPPVALAGAAAASFVVCFALIAGWRNRPDLVDHIGYAALGTVLGVAAIGEPILRRRASHPGVKAGLSVGLPFWVIASVYLVFCVSGIFEETL